jgi:hypothetical protein
VTDTNQSIDQSDLFNARSISMPVGIVVSCYPGVTRWAKQIWKPTALMAGAPMASWVELRREGEAVEYHAATLDLTLYRTDTEAYRVSLSMNPPSAFVIMDEDTTGEAPGGWMVSEVTLSAYEAQDALDSGFSLVEAVPLPPLVGSWANEFVKQHFVEETFHKRKRDRVDVDKSEDGIGDARIAKASDVYRAPGSIRKRTKQ